MGRHNERNVAEMNEKWLFDDETTFFRSIRRRKAAMMKLSDAVDVTGSSPRPTQGPTAQALRPRSGPAIRTKLERKVVV